MPPLGPQPQPSTSILLLSPDGVNRELPAKRVFRVVGTIDVRVGDERFKIEQRGLYNMHEVSIPFFGSLSFPSKLFCQKELG